jgi:hypothetical protein
LSVIHADHDEKIDSNYSSNFCIEGHRRRHTQTQKKKIRNLKSPFPDSNIKINGQCIVSELKAKQALQRSINFIHAKSIGTKVRK